MLARTASASVLPEEEQQAKEAGAFPNQEPPRPPPGSGTGFHNIRNAEQNEKDAGGAA